MKASEKGLTLVELAVVTVLLAFLALTLYRTMSGIGQGREKIEGSRLNEQLARGILSRLSRELVNRDSLPLILPANDFEQLKQKAGEAGVSYQTLVANLIRQFVQGQIQATL